MADPVMMGIDVRRRREEADTGLKPGGGVAGLSAKADNTAASNDPDLPGTEEFRQEKGPKA